MKCRKLPGFGVAGLAAVACLVLVVSSCGRMVRSERPRVEGIRGTETRAALLSLPVEAIEGVDIARRLPPGASPNYSPWRLPVGPQAGSFPGTSTVEEIESAIERLKPTEVAQLAAWLEEYQQMIHASAEMFALYDQEEASCGLLKQASA